MSINDYEHANDMIEYSAYKVIKSYEEEKNTAPRGIYFNKSMYGGIFSRISFLP